MIEAKHVSKTFNGNMVLKDICLFVSRETIGLLGANGSGKTTLLKCLLGILDFKGEIKINDLDVRKNPLATRKLIGYIPQSFPSWGDLTVTEGLHFFAKLRHADKTQETELLGKFALDQHKRKKIRELSGGLKQKLSIAIALLSNPEIIFLDEPTANLDAWAIKDILTILKDFKKQKTVILSSHRIEEILAVANRMVQIKDGVLVEPNINEIRIYQNEVANERCTSHCSTNIY